MGECGIPHAIKPGNPGSTPLQHALLTWNCESLAFTLKK
jgi:hypothetical protein